MTTSRSTRYGARLLVLLCGTALCATAVAAGSPAPAEARERYDAVVLVDRPVAFWAGRRGVRDRTGHGHVGTAVGGTGGTVRLPNGQRARTFDGVRQHVAVPSSPVFSIPRTGALTWEAWIRPAVLQFPSSTRGYVDVLGKCVRYAPTCEWEARMYDAVNRQGRASRISAYAFNPAAGLGSGADWQPAPGTLSAGRWIHVVGRYQTRRTPGACRAAFPGTIDIWVDGIKQNFAAHAPTGCMSQYAVIPRRGRSPLTIGTMARDSWFAGAIGKVAVYDHLLAPARIRAHFTAMTGRAPSGRCADTCTLRVQP